MKHTINGPYDPDQWELVAARVDHPDNPTIRMADLLRNRHTGRYVLFSGMAYCGCPQRWAAEMQAGATR